MKKRIISSWQKKRLRVVLLTVPPVHRDVMHLSIHLFGKKRISSQDRLGKVLGLGAEHCGLAGLGLSACG